MEALERRDLLASYTTPEDTPLVVTDPNLATLHVVRAPEHGTVTPTSAGGFAYVPLKDYNGPDRFSYVLASSTTPTNTAPNFPPGVVNEVSIEVTPVNDPPVARGDEFATHRNSPLVIAAPGVLKNDSDVDHRELQARVITMPTNGTLTFEENGSFKYTPRTDFVGTDSFTYVASDGLARSNEAKVAIVVKSLPDARDDQYSVQQNTVLTVLPRGVLVNDLGSSSFGLIASLEPGDANAPKHGKVELKADGSFVYTPAENYVGPDSFVYRATDAIPALNPAPAAGETTPLPAAFDLARVWIYVRPNPIVRANPDVYTTIVNTKLAVAEPGVLKNDFVLYAEPTTGTNAAGSTILPPSAPLIAALITPPEVGELTLKENGSFEYVPKSGFEGTVSFTYQAKLAPTTASGAVVAATDPNVPRLDIATVTIVVRSLPLPRAQDDYYRMLEGATLDIATPGVLGNDRGESGRLLIAKLDKGPASGELLLNIDGSFKYVAVPGFAGYVTFTYFALDANVLPATPPPFVLATDSNGPILPPRPSNLATVTIYVQDANPPVYAYDDFYRVAMNGELGVEEPGVLGNDSLRPPIPILAPNAITAAGTATAPGELPSPAPIKLTAKLLSEPKNGRLSFNANGSFKYAPVAGFFGTDTFTYQAFAGLSDGSDPATGALRASGETMVSGAPCQITPDGVVTCPPQPAVDDIATVTIYVKQPDPPPGPVARDDFYLTAANSKLGIRAPGVLANDSVRWLEPLPATGTNSLLLTSPPNHLPLTAFLIDPPVHGKLTLNPNGSFEYEPDADYAGLDKFTYQASFPAPGGDPTLSFAPDETPKLLSNIATVTIRVAPALAQNDTYSTLQDQPLVVRTPGVLGNDRGGSEEHPLSAVLLSGPLNGKLELAADGSFVYQPNAAFTGSDVFVYRAKSSLSQTDPAPAPSLTGTTAVGDPTNSGEAPRPASEGDVAIVKIYVRAALPTVQAYPDRYATPTNVALEVAAPGVFANDYALVNHHIFASLGEAPQHGTVIVNKDGSFSYKPNENFVGEDKFTYKATDEDAAASNTAGTVNFSFATVVIHVLPTATPPKFIPGESLRTTDDSGHQRIADWATLVSLRGDSRPDFVVTTDKPHLFAAPPVLDATGLLTYSPAPNVSGQALVTVTLRDGAAANSAATFTIQIDKPHRLHNTAEPCDVTGDSHVAPGDALEVINYLNARGANPIDLPAGEDSALLYYDVSKDDEIAPIDALMIINFLNANQSKAAAGAAPEGESAAATDLSLLAMSAEDALAAVKRKRLS